MTGWAWSLRTRNAVRREFAIRLFELPPELGGGTGGGTVGEVEDWGLMLATHTSSSGTCMVGVAGLDGDYVAGRLTLLNAVLLGALVVLILLLAGDTLDALVEVVLEGGALGGVGAIWID